jgi:hypothetical protein
MNLIDAKDFGDISSFFKGEKGRNRARFIMQIIALDKVNQVYDHSSEFSGAEFASRFLNELGVNYVIGNAERLERLPEGAFITV